MPVSYLALTAKNPGDAIADTDWNQMKDNFIVGVPDIFTAKGDIAVATGADSASPLAVGADNTVLTAASGEATGLAWGAGPSALFARYSTNTDQTVATGSATIINYEDAVFDTDSAVAVGAGWALTVPAAHDGYYLVCAKVVLEASAAWGVGEYAQLWLYKGGVADCILGSVYMHAAGTYIVSVGGAHIVSLAATDTIDIRLLQNSGSNAIIEGASPEGNWVSIARIF